MPVTRFSYLTDEEFIVSLEPMAHHSPVISELITRLQSHIKDNSKDSYVSNDQIECPVCMANLQVDIDWGNDLYTVKVVDQ